MIKKFFIKDFIYNNGIVNFASFLERKNIDFNLTQHFLEVEVDDNKFYEFLAEFIKDNRIIEQTDNKRWFFDENEQKFIVEARFFIKDAGPTDMRNVMEKLKIKPKISEDELYEKLVKFGKEQNFDINRKYSNLSYEPLFDKNKKLKKKLYKYVSIDEFIKAYIDYLIKDNNLELNSKIHTFEDGQIYFHDMLKRPKNYEVDKWDALIYWFGGKIKRWFYFDIYIYPNSINLLYLKRFKDYLKINDSKIQIKAEDGPKSLPTNIDIVGKLKELDINLLNFYISKSEEEVFLKLLIFIFLHFYIIESKANHSHPFLRKKFSELFKQLMYLSFVVYKDEKEFKSAFFEYTRSFKIFEFLFEIMQKDIFKKLIEIMTVISNPNLDKDGFFMKKFSKKFLNFQDLRKIYFEVVYLILKKEKEIKYINLDVYDFEKFYLKFKGENMQIHDDAKVLGEWIGLVSATLDNKDLLYKLRNVKNYKQLLSFFRDFKYVLLKNEDKVGVSKEFDEALERVIKNLEEVWDVVRDYIAIYAINKYKSVKYAKESKQNNQGE